MNMQNDPQCILRPSGRRTHYGFLGPAIIGEAGTSLAIKASHKRGTRENEYNTLTDEKMKLNGITLALLNVMR